MAWIYHGLLGRFPRGWDHPPVDPRHAWMEDPQKSPGICMPGLLHPRMAWNYFASASDGVKRGIAAAAPDRKSTRLNSSHSQISYAVFCLKKKKQEQARPTPSYTAT